MNNILVRSINGLFLGTIFAYFNHFIFNELKNKYYDSQYKYVKKDELNTPFFIGGSFGFLIGFIQKPIIYKFLFKKK